jgi:hypothetical protein
MTLVRRVVGAATIKPEFRIDCANGDALDRISAADLLYLHSHRARE